jgi:polar amino acid transport system substrate-binding protein
MKTTPRLLRIVAAIFALSLVAAACGSDDDASTDTTAGAAAEGMTDLGGREITVAVENAYLPFNYIDAETGEAAGWDYEAIDEICSRLNCVPKYETFSWEPMIQAVSDGQFDMAADGITITSERAEIVDFSDGYINIDQRILVAVDSDINSADDLVAADCQVASQTGTTNYDKAVELLGEDRVSPMEEFGFVIQAVIAGDNCATIIDETAGQGYVGENADEIKLVGESLSSDALGFIFPRGSDLVGPFNEAIAAMKADGSLEALSRKFFTDSFTITYDDIGDPS